MNLEFQNRTDLFHFANTVRFTLRHYAQGCYPVAPHAMTPMPLNRMFFVLRNPNGDTNFIRDSHQTCYLKEKNLYFIPFNHPTEFRLDRTLFFLSVQFNLELYSGIDLFSGCDRMLEWNRPEVLPELLELFHSDSEDLVFSALKAKERILHCALELTGRYPNENFTGLSAWKRYFPLIDFLHARGNAETRVSDLAELMTESREVFSRHFTKETGSTPKQFLDRFLLNRSLDLLASGKPIKEIAFELGFSSEFVFSRFFKRHTGTAPSDWKKRSF